MEKKYTLNNNTDFIIVDESGDTLAIELLNIDCPNFPANISRRDFSDGIVGGYIKANVLVIWQSSYGLMNSPDAGSAWSLSVTGFDDDTFVIDVAQPGDDLTKEFTDIEVAKNWLNDFIGNRYLECDSDFDFRYDQALD